MPVLSGHLFRINLRNYHSARVPSLGFYNFIFLLQCLYPKAPQFISAAQPQWIINGGCEQKDDERHRRSIIHTQPPRTCSGGVLLSLFLCLYLSAFLLKSETVRPAHSLTRRRCGAQAQVLTRTRLRGWTRLTHARAQTLALSSAHTLSCRLCPSSILSRHVSWGSRGRETGRVRDGVAGRLRRRE